MENKYSKGKIYCIKSPQTERIYVGSTILDLNQRLSAHKVHFKNKNLSSKEIIQYDDAYIELIEEFPCETRDELERREGHHIKLNPNCCNKYIAGRTIKEHYQDNREKFKKYYQDNKERLLAYEKQYRIDNHEKKLADDRAYYQKNKEKKRLQREAKKAQHIDV
jgi:hypothetical protein